VARYSAELATRYPWAWVARGAVGTGSAAGLVALA